MSDDLIANDANNADIADITDDQGGDSEDYESYDSFDDPTGNAINYWDYIENGMIDSDPMII